MKLTDNGVGAAGEILATRFEDVDYPIKLDHYEDCEIDHCDFERSTQGFAAAIEVKASDAVITDCEIRDHAYGVTILTSSNEVEIEGCRFDTDHCDTSTGVPWMVRGISVTGSNTYGFCDVMGCCFERISEFSVIRDQDVDGFSYNLGYCYRQGKQLICIDGNNTFYYYEPPAYPLLVYPFTAFWNGDMVGSCG